MDPSKENWEVPFLIETAVIAFMVIFSMCTLRWYWTREEQVEYGIPALEYFNYIDDGPETSIIPSVRPNCGREI